MAPARAAETARPPLERMVRLNLWGAGLDDAAREIRSQTGVEVLFYRADIPANQNRDNLFLVTGDVPLRTALECLAHRYSFRYRVSRQGKIELSRGYDWAAGKPVLKIIRIDGLTSESGGDAKAVEHLLAEFVKPLSLLGGDHSLTLERYPTETNPQGLRCSLFAPETLCGYLEQAVACLEGDAGDQAANGRDEVYAVAERLEPDWEGLLTRKVGAPSGSNLHSLLAEMAAQAGVAITVADPPSTPPDAGLMNLSAPRIGFGGASGELSIRYGLGRRVFLASGAVVFEGGDPEAVLDGRSRELFWDGLAVAGFTAREQAERMGGAGPLLAALKRDVYPHVWRDPVCALGYSPVSGRLAVIAPANVVSALASRLKSMANP